MLSPPGSRQHTITGRGGLTSHHLPHGVITTVTVHSSPSSFITLQLFTCKLQTISLNFRLPMQNIFSHSSHLTTSLPMTLPTLFKQDDISFLNIFSYISNWNSQYSKRTRKLKNTIWKHFQQGIFCSFQVGCAPANWSLFGVSRWGSQQPLAACPSQERPPVVKLKAAYLHDTLHSKI